MNMLKNFLFLVILAILVIIGLNACQPSAPAPDDSLAYIPEQASMVTALRPAQLMEKADFGAIRQSEGYQEMLREARETNPVLAGVMENPESAGIDLNKNIYFSMELREKKQPFTAISMSISDPKAFEALLQSTDVEIQPASNGYHFAGTPGENALAWNDKVAIIGISKNGADAQAELERYLATAPKASIAQNKNLRQALAKDFDIANWISTDFFLQTEKAKNSSILLNYDSETLSGNYIQHFLTFEQGKIHSESAFHLKKRIANDLNMLFHKKVKTDFTAAAPQGAPLFLMAAALDVDGLNQLLIEKYSKGLFEGTLSKYGISTNTLLKAMQGDVMVSAYAPESETGEPKLLLAAKVGDEKALNTILEAAVKEKHIEKAGDNRYRLMETRTGSDKDSSTVTASEDIKGQALLHNGLLYLTNEPALLDKIVNGQVGMEGAIASSAAPLMGQYPFTALGDVQALSKHMGPDVVQSIEATSNLKGANLLIYMKGQNSNSLKTIIETMKKEAAEKEAVEPAGGSEI